MFLRFALLFVWLLSCSNAFAKTFSGLQVYFWTESRRVVLAEFEKYNRDGVELQKHITANDATNNGMFLGFVGGVADGLVKEGDICPSSDDSLSLYLFAIDEYTRKHPRPELYSQDAYKIVTTVLTEKFGCRSK